MFGGLDGELAKHLDAIYYPPVKVLFLGFSQEAIGRPLDGFGFLIPEKENKTFLGAIWSSALFPERAEDGLVAFTLYIGGARSPELFIDGNGALTDRVEKEFREIMAIDENPVFAKEKFWPKAIPQYNVGYIEHERYFETFETGHPGIFLAGNFRGGISVGDCIQNSKSTAERIHACIRNADTHEYDPP
jgi:oxygen-dependent protoporphyrinogen oxidase